MKLGTFLTGVDSKVRLLVIGDRYKVGGKSQDDIADGRRASRQFHDAVREHKDREVEYVSAFIDRHHNPDGEATIAIYID